MVYRKQAVTIFQQHNPEADDEAIVQMLNKTLWFVENPREKGRNFALASWDEKGFCWAFKNDKEMGNLYAPFKVPREGADGKVKMVSYFKIWMDSQDRNQVKDVLFHPGLKPFSCQKDGLDFLNEWMGFPFYRELAKQLVVGDASAQKDLDLVKAHWRDVVFQGSETNWKYFQDWLAHVVQKPDTKTEVCPVITGKQGCGKSGPVEMLARMFHPHSLYLSKNDSLVHKFSGPLLRRAVFVAADEVNLKKKQEMDVVKQMVTAPERHCEGKNQKIEQPYNFCNFVVTSNDDDCLFAEEGSMRRWFQVRCGDEKVGNKKYFEALFKAMKNEQAAKLWFVQLWNRDVRSFNPALDRPHTLELQQQQVAQIGEVDDWWLGMIRDKKHWLWDEKTGEGMIVEIDSFYDSFARAKKGSKILLAEFINKISKRFPDDFDTGMAVHKKIFRMPPYKSCKARVKSDLNLDESKFTTNPKRQRTREQRKNAKRSKKLKDASINSRPLFDVVPTLQTRVGAMEPDQGKGKAEAEFLSEPELPVTPTADHGFGGCDLPELGSEDEIAALCPSDWEKEGRPPGIRAAA